jgi:hypothetical protein
MLSVEQLRETLGRPDLDDDELSKLRDHLYRFAHVLIEGYLRERRGQIPAKPR